MLKGKGAIGQRVSDQIFQLNLAKTAAGLLVRQNILQLRNWPDNCEMWLFASVITASFSAIPVRDLVVRSFWSRRDCSRRVPSLPSDSAI